MAGLFSSSSHSEEIFMTQWNTPTTQRMPNPQLVFDQSLNMTPPPPVTQQVEGRPHREIHAPERFSESGRRPRRTRKRRNLNEAGPADNVED